jgi:hypothetical protein
MKRHVAPALPAFLRLGVFGPSIEGIPTGNLDAVHVTIPTFLMWWIIVEVV